MSDNTKDHHIVPIRIYLAIGTTLLVLTAVTVWASFVDLGSWNVVVALAIASVKATLVVLYFMHLRYDNKMYFIIFLVAIIFLTIFLVFTLFDSMHRYDFYPETGKPIRENAIIYDQPVSDSLNVIPDDSLQTEKPKH